MDGWYAACDHPGMRRSLFAAVLLLACGSSEPASPPEGLQSTGVPCTVTNKICCSGDVGDSPVCHSGTWYCPPRLPEFIESAKCNYSRATPPDTGTVSDGAPSDAADDG